MTNEDVEKVRWASNRTNTVVIGDKTEYAYSPNNYFNADQALGVTPNRYIDLTVPGVNNQRDVNRFLLTSVRYYLDVNGGVSTYQLYLFEAASADNVQNMSDVVFDSGASQAEATAYEWNEGGSGEQGAVTTEEHQLPKIVNCAVPNRLYYQTDWDFAPASSVQGYIKLRGKWLK